MSRDLSVKNKQQLKEMKEEIDNSIVTVGDFNMTLSIMARTTRQKINKATEDLNNPINQLDLTDIYKTLCRTQYTFFSSTYGTLCRIDNMLSYKTSLK